MSLNGPETQHQVGGRDASISMVTGHGRCQPQYPSAQVTCVPLRYPRLFASPDRALAISECDAQLFCYVSYPYLQWSGAAPALCACREQLKVERFSSHWRMYSDDLRAAALRPIARAGSVDHHIRPAGRGSGVHALLFLTPQEAIPAPPAVGIRRGGCRSGSSPSSSSSPERCRICSCFFILQSFYGWCRPWGRD